MMACCALGSVITEMFPASIRNFPSLARIMRESDWLKAPLGPDCAMVWQSAHAGGSDGGFTGDIAEKHITHRAHPVAAGIVRVLSDNSPPARSGNLQPKSLPCIQTPVLRSGLALPG